MEFAEFITTPQVESVILRRPFQLPVEGTLCISGHHLILSSRQDNKEELWLLHKNVDSVEKKLTGSAGSITLRCKDFQMMVLEMPTAEDCISISTSIEQLSNIDNINLSYAFFYRPMFDVMEDGWQAFSAESEYTKLMGAMDGWRISTVNKNFDVCHTYPASVVVPKSIDDETLKKAATFRHLGRFPVLSYYHKENGRVILRSSQPLTGQNTRRCREDEMVINATLGIGKRGYIVDTRKESYAKMMLGKGGGYEPEAHYPQWRRIHQSIERYPLQHESLIKMIEALTDLSSTSDKWLSKLESSQWLTHIKDILTCACVVSQCIDQEGASVLVHGSDGFDTTLQATSLAQVILDPDCRTVRGFEALIDKEWIQGGHPFAERCAKSAFAVSKHRQEAPVFLLFLDCVWQIWQQFPCSFEYNEKFLMFIFQHTHASQFGTFLCNNDSERKDYKLHLTTTSLWSYVNRPEVIQEFMNPLYEPNNAVIWPSVAPQSLGLWSSLYQRSLVDQINQDEAWEEITTIKNNDKDLKSKVVRLRRTLAALEKEAIDAGLIPQIDSQ